jgi:hypothetical protein
MKPKDSLIGLLRFLFCGPIAGTLIGALQTIAAVQVWMAHSQPDFYFRGWVGVDSHLETQMIGGAIVGIPFGISILAYERISSKKLHLLLFVSLLSLLSYLSAWALVTIEFQRRSLFPIATQQILSLCIGCILSPFVSSRPKNARVDVAD